MKKGWILVITVFLTIMGCDKAVPTETIQESQYKWNETIAIGEAYDDENKKIIPLEETLYEKFDEIQLPKWKESYDIAGLEKVFSQSGLKYIFEMGAMPKFSEESVVSQILQKTAIDVTEHGTKAAAVSGGVATEAALPDPEILFVVNHNFAYVIRDRETGTILFAGVINRLDHESSSK